MKTELNGMKWCLTIQIQPEISFPMKIYTMNEYTCVNTQHERASVKSNFEISVNENRLL